MPRPDLSFDLDAVLAEFDVDPHPRPPRRAELLTVREVAAMLRVSERSVRRWVARGDLPVVRMFGVVRVPSWAVEAPPATGGA